jgi:uncharacterized protein
MPERTSNQPGTFAWLELGTSDHDAAKQFYTSLFGWTFNEFPMDEGYSYTIFQKNGKDVAACYKLMPDMLANGVPPHWMSYVAVDSADDAANKAKELGGNVMNGPFDVYDMGRMAVMSDPQGAMFSVWQSKSHHGIQIRDESNTLCWNELQARNVDAAKPFYKSLFGWELKESPEYNEISVGGQPIGGIMQSQAPPEVPSYWMPYFAVDDCDGTTGKAAGSGATTIVPPMDYPGVGRFSVLSDPQGAVFAVIKLELGPHS